MSLIFFFTRHLFYLFLLLTSTSLWAQQVTLCSSCLSEEIALHKNNRTLQVFKCQTGLPNLISVYKWGIMDATGKIIITPEWDSIGTIGRNHAEVYQYIPQRKKTTRKAGLVSFQNKIALPLAYNSIQLIRAPYYRVNTSKGFQVWDEQKGFTNKNTYDSLALDTVGILLYTDQFCHRINLSNGAIEEGNAKQWLMNDNGRVYSIAYDTLYIYRVGENGLTTVIADSIGDGKNTQQVFLFRNGKTISWNFSKNIPSQKIENRSTIVFKDIHTLSDSTLLKIKNRTQADTILLINPLFLFKRNNFWGYGDTVGNVPIAPVYDSLGLMYNDRVAVKIRNKWGFLDRNENIVAQPYYEEVGDYQYGATWVRQQKKYNFLDLSGKVINTHWYDKIEETHRNYIVYYKGKAGLVNHLGQEIISTRYLQVLDFGEGACLVQAEDLKWFLMDYKENRISMLPYSYVYYLSHSKAYILKK